MTEAFDSGECTIRLVEADDFNVVREFHALAFRSSGAGHYTPAQIEDHISMFNRPEWKDIMATIRLFAADHPDEGIVATAGWNPYGTKGTARVRKVYVHPGYQRQGLARRLIEHVHTDATYHGYRCFVVHSSLNAVPLYTALGYTLDSSQPTMAHATPGEWMRYDHPAG